MPDADPSPRGILFDMFGTLVFFDATRLPRVAVGGKTRVLTIARLEEPLGRLSRPPTPTVFLEALVETSLGIEREKREHLREIPTVERFGRVLRALSAQGDVEAVAEDLALRHMQGLAAAVVCPSDRVALLERLAARHRIGLISNFDHGPTARALLVRHGLAALLGTIVISEEVGLRKPAVELFERACTELMLPPSECLHVGDSFDADVLGATAAGLSAVWVDGAGNAPAPARAVIADVSELPGWLARSYPS